MKLNPIALAVRILCRQVRMESVMRQRAEALLRTPAPTTSIQADSNGDQPST